MEELNIAIIYHAGCNDGIAAAWAAWQVLGDDRVQYVGWRYDDPLPDVYGKVVIMVDVSPKPAEAEELRKRNRALAIVDHHDSSIVHLTHLPVVDKWDDFRSMVLAMPEDSLAPAVIMADKSRSGAVLSWLFFHNHGLNHQLSEKDIPYALRLIEDYDLFTKVLPETVPFNDWLAAAGRYIDNFDRHLDDNGRPKEGTIIAGKMLTKQANRLIREIVNNYTRYVEWRGWKVGLVNAPAHLRNEIGESICTDNSVDFALCYTIRKDKVIFSARGRGERINLRELAEEFGGGGHIDASAFAIPVSNHDLLMALGLDDPQFLLPVNE